MTPEDSSLKPAILLAALGLAIASGAPLWASHDERPGLLPYDHPDAVARGAQIYAENCASCHGTDLSGQAGADWRVRDADGYLPAPPHDETGHTWHHPDEVLVAITTHGTEALIGGDYRSRMMGFGEVLSDEEILDVLAFIKSTWPARVIEIHDGINAQSGG
jgi:mono/diheme cytochrome c family protein